MNERQKYLFDLQGYVLVEDVLSPEDCAVAIEKIKQRAKPMEKTPDGYDANGTWQNAAGLYEAGEPFIKLIDHPKITEVLADIIGPALRCESCYSFVRHKNCPPFEMHGGHRGGRVNFRYSVHNGQIYTGLTVVSIALQDISGKDGGFACIPGSHKSDFSVPAEDRKELFALGGSLVQNIAAPKGAAIIFTETLAHGAASWQNDEPRYGLFYKFNDRAAIYHGQEPRRPSAEAFAQMTDAQKCYFNLAYQAFGPAENPRNDQPQFG
ncbi:MAG: ectoine hydroxylase-related dioxygenase (phytanoyl-CoA dioxygenase family) [Candidatus Latescibacterota bacterium]|jgi:ectoine hydroxylase-related dioxygenase (phytanoyl-CoA dioxygenase family)